MDITVTDVQKESGYAVDYKLQFGHATLTLSRQELDDLLLSVAQVVPGAIPKIELDLNEDVYRVLLLRILDLDDREVQILLRNVWPQTLTLVLWYLKNDDLARKVMSNLSKRTAVMLTDDLEYIDRSPIGEQKRRRSVAQESVAEMVNTLYRLRAEGQIWFD